MQCRNAVLLRCSWPIPVLMISVWGGRWKSWAQAASHPGLGLRKVWDEQLVICVPAETSTVLEQTRSLLTGWAGDAAAAGVLCAGHVTRDTCDGCWPGLAASSRCGHQTPTQNHWPRHPPPNSALPRAFQHFTSGLLWRQKYLHDKKIFARLLNSTAKPVQINIFAIFCLNCGSASTRPHHPSSSCSQERGAHRKCIKMTAVAGVAVGWCSLQTACSVIVRW